MMLTSVNLITLFSPIIAIGLALVTTFLLNKTAPLSLPTFRYTSIDGLRGYLAFFVFLHHSFIWHGYIQTGVWGNWDSPNAHLYRYFGSGSVMIFFMITAFLFFGRLLDAKKNKMPVDWLYLYTSRVLRISPLFLFVSFVAFIVSGYACDWKLDYGFAEILKRALLTFGMGLFGTPIVDIFIPQGIGGPVTAGALWTLPYEWIFYFMLPAFAFLLRLRSSKYILIIPALAIWYLFLYKLPRVPANAFLSGMLVAILVRTNCQKFLVGKFSAALATVLIIFSILTFEDPFSFYPLLILTFLFSVVASGNTFFGILNLSVSRAMGEISFGIYLIHGILLFLLTRIILGDAQSIALSEGSYWLCILICVPILITMSYLTFTTIERPCMKLSLSLSEKIRQTLGSKSA